MTDLAHPSRGTLHEPSIQGDGPAHTRPEHDTKSIRGTLHSTPPQLAHEERVHVVGDDDRHAQHRRQLSCEAMPDPVAENVGSNEHSP